MLKNLEKKVNKFVDTFCRRRDFKETYAVPDRPKVVHLAVSRACNVDCIMCPINREVLKDKKKFLDLETFRRIFKDGEDFDFLNFVGAGEVFVAKDFLRMLRYCFDRKFSALGCITNLQLVSPELAELMVQNHFHQITVSIDGCTKETFEYIRHGSRYETTIKTVELFNELKNRYHSEAPHFTFSTVCMNSNIHEFPGLVRLANRYGVKNIYVARLHVSKKEILDESLFFHQAKYNHYYDETIDLCKKLGINIQMPAKFGLSQEAKGRMVRDCKLPFENMYIDVDGIVYPCVCRVYPDTFIGDINDTSLLDLWNSERFNTFRNAMYSDSPPKQCQECTFSVLDPNKPESHMTLELAEKVKKRKYV